jgi:hypothetical protein
MINLNVEYDSVGNLMMPFDCVVFLNHRNIP